MFIYEKIGPFGHYFYVVIDIFNKHSWWEWNNELKPNKLVYLSGRDNIVKACQFYRLTTKQKYKILTAYKEIHGV